MSESKPKKDNKLFTSIAERRNVSFYYMPAWKNSAKTRCYAVVQLVFAM